MGELLVRAAAQQTLLDAWHELRRKAREGGSYTQEFTPFEKRAARRIANPSSQLTHGTWRPSPVTRVDLPKASGGTRRLGIPHLEDRIVERALLEVLDPVVDPHLLPWSYAYRRGLGVRDAIRALLELRDEGSPWVVRGDFANCFDAILRRPVMARLAEVVYDPELLRVIELLVYRPVRGEGDSSPVGLHQGSALSPLLSNLYLDGFDRAMLAHGYRVIRYADDFAIPVADRSTGQDASRRAQGAAASIGLALAGSKCAVHAFDSGVPFLGEWLTSGTGRRTEPQDHPRATTVFVTEDGSLIRSRGAHLRVEHDGEQRLSIAYRRVRQVVAFGRVVMTTPFLQQALTRGVDVVLLDAHGRYFGRIQGATGTNPFVRHGQFRAASDTARSLDIARRIVEGKITNMRTGLLRFTRRAPDPEIRAVVGRMGAARTRTASTSAVEELMGVEGAATRDYFLGLGRILDEWEFVARRRRPPPDPVNSVLSLGYTLLLHDALAAIETVGLDPYSGFLHQARVGRPGLALDLIEEMRPVIVDSVVVRCLNTGILKPADFSTDPGPPQQCRLTKSALRRFVAAYERRMLTLFTHTPSRRRVSYRVGLFLQAKALADELVGNGRYSPILWK